MAVSPRPWTKPSGYQSAESLSSLTIALTAQHPLPPRIERLVLTGVQGQRGGTAVCCQPEARTALQGNRELTAGTVGGAGPAWACGLQRAPHQGPEKLRGVPQTEQRKRNLELNADGDQAETGARQPGPGGMDSENDRCRRTQCDRQNVKHICQRRLNGSDRKL